MFDDLAARDPQEIVAFQRHDMAGGLDPCELAEMTPGEEVSTGNHVVGRGVQGWVMRLLASCWMSRELSVRPRAA